MTRVQAETRAERELTRVQAEKVMGGKELRWVSQVRRNPCLLLKTPPEDKVR